MSSIYDSLNALKDTLNTSNEKVSSFRKQNADFKWNDLRFNRWNTERPIASSKAQ